MKKVVLFIAIGLCIVIATWYLVPKPVHKKLDGFAYQLGNEEGGEMVEIEIDGKQRYTFTGTRIFTGTIEVEGQELPVPPQARELELKFEAGNSSALFYLYLTKENGNPKYEIYSLGQINTNKDFSQLTIRKLNEEGSWSGSEGWMIAAPATNRKEALEISDKLIEELQLNGDIFIDAEDES